MSELPDNKYDAKHEKYAGPSAPAQALLEGRVYGFFGGLIGLVGGAALAGTAFKSEGRVVKQVGSSLEHWGIPPEGKVGLVIISALIGSAVMHRIGNVVGIAIGTKKSGEAEAQFDRTQDRIAKLENKLERIEGQTPARFAAREAERSSAHEAAIER
jgi:hypothetical protein